MKWHACIVSFLVGVSGYANQVVPGINSVLVDPYLAVNKEGQALVVWNTGGSLGGHIEYSLFSGQSHLFTQALVVPGLTTSTQYVSAAINSKKEALVVWNTVTGGIQYAVYHSDKMDAAASVEGASPYSTTPKVVLNDQGEGLAVWSDANKNIQYAPYHKITKRFASAQKLPNVKTGQDLQIVFNSQGEGILLWHDLLKQSLSYAIYNPQTSEFKVIRHIENTKDAQNPSLVLNDRGEALLAWNTGSVTTPAGFLQYAVYQKEKQSFTAFKTMPASKDGLAQNMLPQIALNEKGDAVMVWSQLNATSKTPILYAMYDKKAKKFGPAKAVEAAALYSTAPQVAMNDHGDMVATWFSTQNGLIQYSFYNKSSKGFGPVYAMVDSRPTDQFPQLILNEAGEGVILWGSLGSIKYSVYNKETHQFSRPAAISSSR